MAGRQDAVPVWKDGRGCGILLGPTGPGRLERIGALGLREQTAVLVDREPLERGGADVEADRAGHDRGESIRAQSLGCAREMTETAAAVVVGGITFGTLSGRAVVVRAADGEELGSAETVYPHAVMSDTLAATGAALPPNWALQDADDYIEVLRDAVPAAVAAAGVDPASVVGIATDFTACTMVPVLADGTPLSRLDRWRERPHAWVKLWKHHAAQGQADRINELAAARGDPGKTRRQADKKNGCDEQSSARLPHVVREMAAL